MRYARELPAFFAASIMLGAFCSAGSYSVPYMHVGGFYAPPAGMAPPLIPDNDPSFQNYFMGRTTVSGFTTTERRTFFAFDLSGLAIPDGETIVSVDFEITLLFGGIIANFSDGLERVRFTSTSTPYEAIADPMGTMTDPGDTFDTFGTGELYGAVEFSSGSPAMPGSISVPFLEAAFSDIEAAIDADGIFVVSGRLETFDPAMDALYEFVFGLTDLSPGSPTPLDPTLIIVTAPITIPAPLAGFMAAPMIAGLFSARRRRIV